MSASRPGATGAPGDAVVVGAGRVPGRRGLSLTVLVVNQLLAGVGVASGIAVAALLTESLTGTPVLAGLSQSSAVLGAGIVAIPLARLAVRRGRHVALGLGYALAALGALLVIAAAVAAVVPLVFLGLMAFGAATAAGLQARFAATEVAKPGFEARSMSLVLWATTLGSVAGPNLSELGDDVGRALGLPPLVGPFLFSGAAFAASTLLVALLLRLPRPGELEADEAPASRSSRFDASDASKREEFGTHAADGMDAADDVGAVDGAVVADASGRPPEPSATTPASVGSWAALRIAMGERRARLALAAIICSQTVMVGVMVMTPVHMHAHGMPLGAIGLVISIHILGMYGASPFVGWLADRIGSPAVIAIGVVVLFAATLVGVLAPADDMLLVPVALGLLGLGWSAGMIGGSTLLTTSVSPSIRVPLQGASDAAMNLAAAIASAFSGLVLGLGGFAAVNVVAMVVLIPLVIAWAQARFARG
ncbi:MFS transporter [Agromyces soli]